MRILVYMSTIEATQWRTISELGHGYFKVDCTVHGWCSRGDRSRDGRRIVLKYSYHRGRKLVHLSKHLRPFFEMRADEPMDEIPLLDHHVARPANDEDGDGVRPVRMQTTKAREQPDGVRHPSMR